MSAFDTPSPQSINGLGLPFWYTPPHHGIGHPDPAAELGRSPRILSHHRSLTHLSSA
ncbi:hypothetical protein COMA2_290020 [Candidatus Nitrospira nitrificans]|uniref:Uncharacterized protein n=1 Tax=Candidatus Nitrospira nitrificans TaxID=1742973 RepID=A0A0S4LH74_9BACT|nr:hypothetical protein COMA2_290020 [Candidatus Nitrospira nitrificans]